MDKPYYISFDTIEFKGEAIKAVRVNITTEIVKDKSRTFAIDLVNHPLYPILERYVLDNLSKKDG